MKSSILFIGLSIASVVFGAGVSDHGARPETFFPVGRHSCDVYGGMMTRVGTGVVDIRKEPDGGIELVVESRGKKYPVRFSPDLAQCLFLERVRLNSAADFSPESGGALGKRISRTWSSDRYTVMIGYTFKDQLHVVYLRDRITNDPLLIAKFAFADGSR